MATAATEKPIYRITFEGCKHQKETINYDPESTTNPFCNKCGKRKKVIKSEIVKGDNSKNNRKQQMKVEAKHKTVTMSKGKIAKVEVKIKGAKPGEKVKITAKKLGGSVLFATIPGAPGDIVLATAPPGETLQNVLRVWKDKIANYRKPCKLKEEEVKIELSIKNVDDDALPDVPDSTDSAQLMYSYMDDLAAEKRKNQKDSKSEKQKAESGAEEKPLGDPDDNTPLGYYTLKIVEGEEVRTCQKCNKSRMIAMRYKRNGETVYQCLECPDHYIIQEKPLSAPKAKSAPESTSNKAVKSMDHFVVYAQIPEYDAVGLYDVAVYDFNNEESAKASVEAFIRGTARKIVDLAKKHGWKDDRPIDINIFSERVSMSAVNQVEFMKVNEFISKDVMEYILENADGKSASKSKTARKKDQKQLPEDASKTTEAAKDPKGSGVQAVEDNMVKAATNKQEKQQQQQPVQQPATVVAAVQSRGAKYDDAYVDEIRAKFEKRITDLKAGHDKIIEEKNKTLIELNNENELLRKQRDEALEVNNDSTVASMKNQIDELTKTLDITRTHSRRLTAETERLTKKITDLNDQIQKMSDGSATIAEDARRKEQERIAKEYQPQIDDLKARLAEASEDVVLERPYQLMLRGQWPIGQPMPEAVIITKHEGKIAKIYSTTLAEYNKNKKQEPAHVQPAVTKQPEIPATAAAASTSEVVVTAAGVQEQEQHQEEPDWSKEYERDSAKQQTQVTNSNSDKELADELGDEDDES